MLPETELEVIHRIKNGEIDAFEILIKKYEKCLFIFAGNFLRAGDKVEDLVQEVFLAAYRNIHSFDPELGHFSNWLMRIARNKCLNEIKRKKGVPISEVREMPGKGNPEKDLVRKEIRVRLDRAAELLLSNPVANDGSKQ